MPDAKLRGEWHKRYNPLQTVDVLVGRDQGPAVPQNTSQYRYVKVSTNTAQNCTECKNKTIYVWEIYEVKPVYKTVTETEEVPVYKTVPVYERQTVPVWSVRDVEKVEYVTEPVYKEVEVPVYENVTYYRSATRKCTATKVDYKWSNSDNDATLKAQGYTLTGVKEAI